MSLRLEITRLESATKKEPGSTQGWNKLVIAHRRLARWRGDHSADGKAWVAVQKALAADPKDGEALALKGWAQAGMHDFEGAAESARWAAEEQPESAWNYGVLADALTELGRYPEAVEAVAEMMKRRPGVDAYSRAANLRALHGDREVAVALMKIAVEASSPNDPEGLAWCRVMLGREYQALGRHRDAQAEYELALATVSNYHLALFHLAESRASEGRLSSALETVQRLRRPPPPSRRRLWRVNSTSQWDAERGLGAHSPKWTVSLPSAIRGKPSRVGWPAFTPIAERTSNEPHPWSGPNSRLIRISRLGTV